tara:strand:- start:760 stop:990 length:231 start_codon:yes stop_codon:yes gene_type:complete
MENKDIKVLVIEQLIVQYKEMQEKEDYSFVTKDTLLEEISRLEMMVKYMDKFKDAESTTEIETAEVTAKETEKDEH